MKYLSAIIAILVACLMAGSALAVQHEGGQQGEGQPQTEYTLLAHSSEGGYFTLEDGQQDQQQDQQQQDQQQQDQQDQQQQDQQQQDQQQQDQQQQDQQQQDQQQQDQEQQSRNPTLMVPPGEQITITLRAADSDGEHNFCVDLSGQDQQQQDQQQQDQQQQDQQQQDQQQQDQQQQDQQQQDQQQQDQQQQDQQQQDQQQQNGPQCSESVSQEGDEVQFNFTVPDSGQTGQTGEGSGQQNQTYWYFSETSQEQMRGQIVVQEDTGADPFQPEDPEQQPDGEEEATPGPALIGVLAVLGLTGLFVARRRRD